MHKHTLTHTLITHMLRSHLTLWVGGGAADSTSKKILGSQLEELLIARHLESPDP